MNKKVTSEAGIHKITKVYKSKKSAINKVKYKQTKARSHKAMDWRTDAELGNTDDLTTQTKTHMD